MVMKNIMRYIIPVFVLLTCTVAVTAQQQGRGRLSVSANELSKRGDSLYVRLGIDASGVNVEPQRTLDLIPVISAGTRELELPVVTIAGRGQYRVYDRALRLLGYTLEEESRYALEEKNRYAFVAAGNRSKLQYNYVVAYEPWMENAVLDLKQDLCGCGRYIRQMEVRRLADNISFERVIEVEKAPVVVSEVAPVVSTPYRVVPSLAYVRPETEAVKQRAAAEEANLTFAVSRTDIRPEMGNNYNELSKIRQFITSVNTDRDVVVRGVVITGYASPEGSYELNRRLSEGRALALSNYLQQNTNIPRHLYKVNFGGEDWDGLVRLVETSNMMYRDEVLSIILYTPVISGREKRLMDLYGGVPYRYMLANMFPSLRRVVVTADYDVRQFSLDEAKHVFTTRPQNLSLNEMFLVANTYEKGSREFNEVFKTAVRMFPDDQVANLNAAAGALSSNDLAMAEQYLRKANPALPEYNNNMGVLRMLQGEYSQARDFFNRARAAGVAQAVDNISELDKLVDSKK